MPTDDPTNVAIGDWLHYQHAIYRFTLHYPPAYTIREIPHDEFAQFTPQPMAVITFCDQHNPLVTIAPPAFSIRVFKNKPQKELIAWLIDMALFFPQAGWRAEEYQGNDAVGIKVLSPNYMAPGWFVYIGQGNWVFQLTPLGVEGEAMLNTFSVSS